jgi:membrane-associated protease RseP (regulator of RpoE activity)
MSDESHVTSLGAEDVPVAHSATDEAGGPKVPVLVREAVLPRERGRGMAGVAIVCSMAGVASGLALAATLMAVQIADRSQYEQRSSCWRHRHQEVVADPRGWLGLEYIGRSDGAHVIRVFSGTPAQQVGIQAGDIIRNVNGEAIDEIGELQFLVRNAGAGAQPVMTVDHNGELREVRPLLSSFPIVVRR